MKILIDGRFYGLENAGLGRYTMNLLWQLQKLDARNKYYILLRKKYFDELKLSKNFEKVLADVPHYSFEEQIKTLKIIKKINPDLTHFLHFNVPIFFDGKFVVTIHDMTMHNQKTDATSLFLPKYWFKQFGYKKVFKNAVLKSQRIIVPSEFVKNEIVKNFKISDLKIIVTYEGITKLSSPIKFENLRISATPPDLSNFICVQKENYFLYVGNSYPHKNLERVIKAAQNLKVNFVIVTKNNLFSERLPRSEFVRILHGVSDEELKILYKNSLGFVFASLSEGFGLPGLEAMENGTILLCSNIPVFREIYDDHSVYFDPKDIDEIAGAMRKVLEFSKSEREKMILENKKFVKKYSWEKMAKETLEVYESCYCL